MTADSSVPGRIWSSTSKIQTCAPGLRQQRGELATDDPAADDRHPFRPLRPVECLGAGDDPVARRCPILGWCGARTRWRARCCGSPAACSPSSPVTSTSASAVSSSGPLDHLDLAGGEQPGQALHHVGDDGVLASEGGFPVELRLTGGDPELGGALDDRVHMRRLQPCLGRDAPPHQTRPAHRVHLDHGHIEPEVVGIRERRRTRRARRR